MSAALQTYLQDVAAHLKAGNATEHTHRPALQNLLNALLPNYHITNEPRRIACGAPDFVIAKGEIPIGHIEAKNIGVNLDKEQKSEQLARYLPALNNLLFTDYLEFRWFVNADYKADMTVKLADVLKNGELKIYPETFERFESLLTFFVETQIITLKSPEELAQKMANIAKQMKHSIFLAYENEDENGKIHNQLKSFREVLIDTLKPEEFSDMVAQTICYGLFAAKCSAVDAPFSRLTAVSFVPKTNPFLRQFFNQLAGIDLDERLVWMVEHLVAVLNRADMSAILADFGKRTRQEDPVVHFYETFLANYDAKLREVRGVYYTPEPVVSYIVRSVDLVLKNQFGLRDGLADSSKLDNSTIHKVQILDPATGTGTFLHAVIAKIYERFAKQTKGGWSDYVSQHLLPRVHGFELLMAAYTVAHIKLSLQLKNYGYDFKSDERLRVFLTNTLDEAHGKQTTMLSEWLSTESNEASKVKRDSPVMVILGNPPYSYVSMNNEKWISDLVRDYYQVDGMPLNERNPKGLQDDYVKFIRFAQWRIMQTGYGVLAFVTNHGYLDNPTFRGMRQSLLNDFDEIYILDLHGNSKKKETALDGSADKNVFDIQQGVAIGIFVKHRANTKGRCDFSRTVDIKSATKVAPTKIYHAHLFGERKSKYQWLAEHDIKNTDWTTLKPQAPFYLFVPQNTELLPEYNRGWKITEMMPLNSAGLYTARDNLAIQKTPEKMLQIINDFAKLPVEEAREKYDLGDDSRDWKVEFAQKDLNSNNLDKTKILPISYRPFDTRFTFYTGKSRGFICMPRPNVMQHMILGENLGFVVARQCVGNWRYIFVSKFISDFNLTGTAGSYGSGSIIPLYIYPTEKSGLFNLEHETRKANFSPAFILDLESRLKLKFIDEDSGDFETTISALDVFHYMYAVFHSPTYRTRYAEFLKIDFPRLPLTNDKALFQKLASFGAELVAIHLMNADIENASCFDIEGDNVVEKIEFKDNKVFINKTQFFDNVSPDVWNFHIGGYQVCNKWLKDRKGRVLNYDDCKNYLYILAALEKTQVLMVKINETMPDFTVME